MSGGTIRIGDWLFAHHGRWSLRPDLDVFAENGVSGFSLWWFCFEIAFARVRQ